MLGDATAVDVTENPSPKVEQLVITPFDEGISTFDVYLANHFFRVKMQLNFPDLLKRNFSEDCCQTTIVVIVINTRTRSFVIYLKLS